MIGFEEAQRAVLGAAVTLGTERVPLQAAVGRVAARSLFAADDLVPFARSAMDGYAIDSGDVTETSTRLLLRAAVYAERSALRRHLRGTATPIATGAPMPEGADAVVPLEDVRRDGDEVVFSFRPISGSHVFPPGEDARAGDLLVPEGAVIRPAALGLLAAAGIAVVDVFRQPRVALICCGEELVEVGAAPVFGQIRNSNATMLAAQLVAAGACVMTNECVRDEQQELAGAIGRALDDADLVIATGGASVGERDFMKPVMRRAGVTFAFDEVALRPARPFGFGKKGDVFVTVLPGNPSSAFVAVVEFVVPLVRAMQGNRQPLPARVPAVLLDRLHSRPNRHYAPYVALSVSRTGFEAMPLSNQCSALTRTAAEAAGLAIVPPGDCDLVAGDVVEVDIIDWSRVESRRTAFALA